jgi:DNA-binding HxlR family transcriptional regulator
MIKAAVPDITDRMLSERLRSLETEGLVTRMVLPESPVRVEYELTDMGRSLESALKEIGSWAERWFPADSPAPMPLPVPAERAQSAAPIALPIPHRGPRIRAR